MPLATTLMFCGESGVMDPESVYLANLHTAVSFDVTGDGMLDHLGASGMPILVYSSG